MHVGHDGLGRMESLQVFSVCPPIFIPTVGIALHDYSFSDQETSNAYGVCE